MSSYAAIPRSESSAPRESLGQTIHRLLPLLRFPLLLNNLVACILSFMISNVVLLVLGIFFVVSLVFNSIALLRYHKTVQRYGDAVSERRSGLGLMGCADLLLGITFFLLWILGEIFGIGYRLIGTHAAFGACIAWSFHSFMAVIELHTATMSGRSTKPLCAECGQGIRGSPEILQGMVESDPNTRTSLDRDANEEGYEEGDALIIPDQDE